MTRGFTLIETLVAITLLTVAIVAPMSLTGQSLSAAYYARDQITAFHLGQEAIEAVRHLRDHNILENALGTQTDLLDGIIPSGQTASTFTIDTRDDEIQACGGTCPPLQTDPVSAALYGYENGWNDTRFTRTVYAEFVGDSEDEVRITVTVSWTAGPYQTRQIRISEGLYRWVNDGSAAQ